MAPHVTSSSHCCPCWGRLWGLLGPSWELKGCRGTILGTSGAALDALEAEEPRMQNAYKQHMCYHDSGFFWPAPGFPRRPTMPPESFRTVPRGDLGACGKRGPPTTLPRFPLRSRWNAQGIPEQSMSWECQTYKECSRYSDVFNA